MALVSSMGGGSHKCGVSAPGMYVGASRCTRETSESPLSHWFSCHTTSPRGTDRHRRIAFTPPVSEVRSLPPAPPLGRGVSLGSDVQRVLERLAGLEPGLLRCRNSDRLTSAWIASRGRRTFGDRQRAEPDQPNIVVLLQSFGNCFQRGVNSPANVSPGHAAFVRNRGDEVVLVHRATPMTMVQGTGAISRKSV